MKKKTYPESYRLPDGSLTDSAEVMCEEWKKIYEPFCKATGCQIIGFDPGMLFRTENDGTVDLPVSLVVKINSLIKK